MGSLRALEERAAGVMPSPECSVHSERAGGAVGKLVGIALLASCLVFAGCSNKVARRDRPQIFESQNSQWALVMSPASVHPLSITTGNEVSRRNDSLNKQTPRATLASDRWPEDPRPNLRNDRRLYLPTNDHTYLYFDNSFTRSSRHTRHWR